MIASESIDMVWMKVQGECRLFQLPDTRESEKRSLGGTLFRAAHACIRPAAVVSQERLDSFLCVVEKGHFGS